jgi:site-specific recombinase XerD
LFETYIRIPFIKGVSIYEVSKLFGHADIKTTQIYAHLRSDDLRNAVERLG